MADKNCFGTWAEAFEDVFDERFAAGNGEGDRLADVFCAGFFAVVAKCPIAGAIFQIGREYLITGRQGKAFGDDIDGIGRVRRVDDIVCVAVNIGGQCLPGLLQVIQSVDGNELSGFEFEFTLPALIIVEYGSGAGAEGAEVQIGNGRVEQELRL